MSIFKTQGIVLHVGKYSEKELLYTVFFRDYWILKVKKKKKLREKPIDVWYYINCEVMTHSEKRVHTVGNIGIKCFFVSEGKTYKEIELFLRLIQQISSQIPQWNPHYEVYDILSQYIQDGQHCSIILTYLKILQCLWNLGDTHRDMNTQKVLKFIHSHHYKDVLKLKNIPEDTRKNLEQML